MKRVFAVISGNRAKPFGKPSPLSLRLPSLALLAAAAFVPIGNVDAGVPVCVDCHSEKVTAWSASKHASLACSTCHEGADDHVANPAIVPEVHFDMEVCKACHTDQYESFRTDMPGRTFYGGSDDGPTRPRGWSKTANFPWWNVLIDGHPFVLETYEDRAMCWNQIDHQATIRPHAEACLECHGTKVAYYMGIKYRDGAGNVVDIPGRERTIRNTHVIDDADAAFNPQTRAWDPLVTRLEVPAGTRVSTFTDALDPLHPYQVKTVVKLLDGRIYASYEYRGATATGMDPDPVKRAEARRWIYSALEALAFDGLDYALGPDPFTGGGYNWPSILAGELCTQCHDPHSGRLRIIKKSLIEGIARNGVNPYSTIKSQIRDFSQASRQDQIVAVCAQCHSEYVGGYSAVDGIDRDFFPWAKPAETEMLYSQLFGNNQDWVHGIGVRPWQNINPNDRGYNPDPALALYPIGETLIKSQHPEAEVFWNSPMYNGGMCGGGGGGMGGGGCGGGGMGGGGTGGGGMGEGATCTDCHSARITKPDGTVFTSHWFASPIKYMAQGVVPCQKCHMMMTAEGATMKIKDIQDQFFALQGNVQVGLVDALKRISAAKLNNQNVAAPVAAYKQAHFRWEYYTQAENSMGFHNRQEAAAQLTVAGKLIAGPAAPSTLRVWSVTRNSITLTWRDNASNEDGSYVEHSTDGGSTWLRIAETAPGVTRYTDSGLKSRKTYRYRVQGFNFFGTSAYSNVASGTTQ
ncbi:MAG TPA: ammonia-forming cytochrome c nitrite reductase subunit c552 [Verrucomicrobiae bacterium]